MELFWSRYALEWHLQHKPLIEQKMLLRTIHKQTLESEQNVKFKGFLLNSVYQIRIKFRLLKIFLATHRQIFEVWDYSHSFVCSVNNGHFRLCGAFLCRFVSQISVVSTVYKKIVVSDYTFLGTR